MARSADRVRGPRLSGSYQFLGNFKEFHAAILDDLRDASPMADFWTNWLEAVRFTCEAQCVISSRLLLFASGAPNAAVEAKRMVAEKVAAFADAHQAAERALANGLGLYEAAERAYQPFKRCVRANSDRLGLWREAN
jgi:hypothetical protein